MAVRASAPPLSWPFWGFLVAILAGLLLAGHQREAFAEFSLLFSYGYWVLRLTMAFLLFAGCLLLLEMTPLAARLTGNLASSSSQSWTPSWSWTWLAGAAALITLPLFTLSVTMLDLLLGLPELDILGIGVSSGPAESYSASVMAMAFARESLYHLDNHLVLCALIVLPRVVQELRATGEDATVAEETEAPRPVPDTEPAALRPAFFQRFDPPLKGPVFAVQAQEHYVRVVTAEGAGCTLYRFGDALRELEGLNGLQVHRSFWVADAGVAALKSGRRGIRIVLRNGEQVPVSARHADMVQRRYSARLGTVA